MGWLGTGLLLLGTILLGFKLPEAWLISALGSASWLYKSIRTRQTDLAITNVAFLALSLWNYACWRLM